MSDRAIAPVRRQIVVPVAPEVAFEVFTAEIAAWWPLGAGLSVYGAGGTVRFVDGQLVEESAAGAAVWGRVLAWEPPDRLRMTWHPGHDPADHSDLSVRFAAVGDGSQTLVTLEHSGWERLADPFGARSEYANGWVAVFGRYEKRAGAARPDVTDKADVWLALMHTPGVHAPADGNVFARTEFGEHMAFIGWLSEQGVRVAG